MIRPPSRLPGDAVSPYALGVSKLWLATRRASLIDPNQSSVYADLKHAQHAPVAAIADGAASSGAAQQLEGGEEQHAEATASPRALDPLVAQLWNATQPSHSDAVAPSAAHSDSQQHHSRSDSVAPMLSLAITVYPDSSTAVASVEQTVQQPSASAGLSSPHSPYHSPKHSPKHSQSSLAPDNSSLGTPAHHERKSSRQMLTERKAAVPVQHRSPKTASSASAAPAGTSSPDGSRPTTSGAASGTAESGTATAVDTANPLPVLKRTPSTDRNASEARPPRYGHSAGSHRRSSSRDSRTSRASSGEQRERDPWAEIENEAERTMLANRDLLWMQPGADSEAVRRPTYSLPFHLPARHGDDSRVQFLLSRGEFVNRSAS